MYLAIHGDAPTRVLPTDRSGEAEPYGHRDARPEINIKEKCKILEQRCPAGYAGDLDRFGTMPSAARRNAQPAYHRMQFAEVIPQSIDLISLTKEIGPLVVAWLILDRRLTRLENRCTLMHQGTHRRASRTSSKTHALQPKDAP